MIQIKSNEKDYYKPGAGLLAAINTALFLRRPLLLAGEPGTGKTDCADYIARELKRSYPESFTADAALRFNTKSVSQSSDLFYYYDAVSHFGDKSNRDKEYFFSFNSLGLALLRTLPPEPASAKFRNYQSGVADKNPPFGSVVLIDEIDKAPRDLPNDLLAELEKQPFKFCIRELSDLEFVQDPAQDIVIVITSNNEKGLPDAFLRRCIFHYINFPEPADLLEIILSKPIYTELNKEEKSFLKYAVAAFMRLRKEIPGKPPATSELIDWIVCLKQNALLTADLSNLQKANPEYKTALLQTLSVLAKSKSDFDQLSKHISG